MDRITVKKIIEINLKKGKVSKILKSNCTLKTYNNFIDAVDAVDAAAKNKNCPKEKSHCSPKFCFGAFIKNIPPPHIADI